MRLRERSWFRAGKVRLRGNLRPKKNMAGAGLLGGIRQVEWLNEWLLRG